MAIRVVLVIVTALYPIESRDIAGGGTKVETAKKVGGLIGGRKMSERVEIGGVGESN